MSTTSTIMTSDDVNDDGNSDNNDANDKDGGDGNNGDGKWNTTAVMTTTTTTMMMINVDIVDDDDDNDRMTMVRWRRVRLDDDDVMAMGGHRHAECSRVPRQPSEATINLCRQFGEKSTRERDNFGGGDETTEKGRGGGD